MNSGSDIVTDKFNVIIVGDGAVGKSSLLHR